MKVSKYLEDAECEILEEQKAGIVAIVKESLKRVNEAKKTLRKLEESHAELLETETGELEISDFEY